MINILKNLIEEHKEWLNMPGSKLSFMKLSTPTSGTEFNNGKVLIFVFEEGQRTPTLCVKTVRTYAAGDIIRKGFANLKLIQSEMFATPLYLHDDGVEIFSIETVCHGSSLSSNRDKLDLVIEKYLTWRSPLQHGDLTPDNVLIDRDKVYIIDYDYVGSDWPAGFDLYTLIWKSRLSQEMTKNYLDKYLPSGYSIDLYREFDQKRKANKI